MASGEFKSLTLKHGIKLTATFHSNVEDISRAVGEKAGHSSSKWAVSDEQRRGHLPGSGGNCEPMGRDRNQRRELCTGSTIIPTSHQGSPVKRPSVHNR
ncbi:hypothetical protein F2P81_013236 [Scophthalmus maximus]|uniref:Uncharacterized protein n=1 Tax=Scophthalmus maximus TaxID=52904 RepID=A0A6A4STP5_SCOMX|nr:hypothetical protein F2P81_013236 [Scophthalmus maximus]